MHDDDRDAMAIGTFREELREMPVIQRWVIYASSFCLVMLLLQCFLVMPIILIKYGWGFDLSGDGS